MPNIELHGFDAPNGFSGPRQEITKAAVWEMFSKEPFISDLVITTFPTWVEDFQGKSQPFIRVVSTPSPHIRKIVQKLSSLNVDIEVLELKAFHPKKH